MKLFNFKKKEHSHKPENNYEDPYINIGNIVRENRIKRNLSKEDLSSLSKIPASTIEAIENNIKELIPPFPFTKSVLLKLEECLLLEKFKLINLAKKENNPIKKRIKSSFTLNKFDIFNSLQGSFIYLFIILISIFVLNSYYLNNKIIEFKYIEKTINEN